MSAADGVEASYTDSGSQERASDSTDVSKDAKIGQSTGPNPATLSLSVSRGKLVVEYSFSDPYVSFEHPRKCQSCDAETPFLFHYGVFINPRICAKHMSAKEKEMVVEMYRIMEKAQYWK